MNYTKNLQKTNYQYCVTMSFIHKVFRGHNVMWVVATFAFLVLANGCDKRDNSYPPSNTIVEDLQVAVEKEKCVREIYINNKCDLVFEDGSSISIDIDKDVFKYYVQNLEGQWMSSDIDMELFEETNLYANINTKNNGLSKLNMVFEDNVRRKIKIKLSNGQMFEYDKTQLGFSDFRMNPVSEEIINFYPIITLASNRIKVLCPCYAENKKFIPCFNVTESCHVFWGEKEVISGETIIDLSSKVQLLVKTDWGGQNVYEVVLVDTGLPTLFIDTPNSAGVDSKETWMANTQMKIWDNDGTKVFEDDNIQIKGRGCPRT